MALLTVGPTFDQAKIKINKILGIQNSEIWLFDDVNKINSKDKNGTFAIFDHLIVRNKWENPRTH